MRLFSIFGCVALTAVGCGGSSSPSETLTCAWLSGADDCWGNAVAVVDRCLPAVGQMWTLTGDNGACFTPDGTIVTFTPPLVLPIPNNATWNFTLADASGMACVQYEDDGHTKKLVAEGTQTVTVAPVGTSGMAITCPDGRTVQTADVASLANCPFVAEFGLPGLVWSSQANPPFVSVGLSGPFDNLFTCMGGAP